MPSVTVHLRLADRALAHWGRHPGGAPFDPDDGDAANAFRQGAFGPDCGYVPGGHRPLSDLAHCLHTGDLGRALLNRARTPQERAFAWGWVTHLLGDTLIHPLVGCAVGELVHGSPARFEDGDRQPVAHVRVESGLDAVYAEAHPELRRIALRAVFDATGIGFVVEAFRETYGAAPAPSLFLRSHQAAARRSAQGLALAAWTALTLRTRPAPLRNGPAPAGVVDRLRSALAERSVGLAYVLPVPPSVWFLDAVREVEEQFLDLFLEEVESGGAGLANVNLDTGRPDLEERTYGGLNRSLTLLREIGGRIPVLPPARPSAMRVA